MQKQLAKTLYANTNYHMHIVLIFSLIKLDAGGGYRPKYRLI